MAFNIQINVTCITNQISLHAEIFNVISSSFLLGQEGDYKTLQNVFRIRSTVPWILPNHNLDLFSENHDAPSGPEIPVNPTFKSQARANNGCYESPTVIIEYLQPL